MDTEKPYQTPQDSARKPLPFLKPAGRVEEFYDFSAPGKATGNTPLEPSANSKKLPKLTAPKPKEKITVKPEPKKIIKPEIVQKGEPFLNDTIALMPAELPDISGFEFLKDTIQDKFELNFLKPIAQEQASIEGEGSFIAPAIDYAPSVFTGHEIQVVNLKPLKLAQKADDGIFIAFLAILCVFSLAKVGYYKKFKQYLSAFFNLRMNIQVLRAEKSVNEQLYFLMLTASLLITSVFVYQWFVYLGLDFSLFEGIIEGFVFLKIFLLILSAIFLKFTIVKLSGFLFNAGRITSDYIFNQILFFNMLNLALFPICVVSQYSALLPNTYFFLSGGIIAAMVFVFMFQRLLVLGNSETGTSTYYLFLYLCILEILPVIILARLLLNAVG
jgi:hypothetical protein